MAHFAVPCVMLVVADTDEQAYEVVNLQVQNHYLGTGISVLLDETLDAFQFDPDTFEVHTALDGPRNLTKAKGYAA